MLSEIKAYIESLNQARAQILQTIEGLNAEALNWPPLPNDTNSLIVLAVHSLGAERRWIHQVVGKRNIERDRAAEFRTRAESAPMLSAQYAAVALESENILAGLTEKDLELGTEGHTVRWCIMHIVEHYYEHAGQMTLTRQLWEHRSQK
jgi:uncharacterized damage-inducible protein DinB